MATQAEWDKARRKTKAKALKVVTANAEKAAKAKRKFLGQPEPEKAPKLETVTEEVDDSEETDEVDTDELLDDGEASDEDDSEDDAK